MSTVISVLLNIIPFLLIIILNCLLYKSIKKRTSMIVSVSSPKLNRDLYVATILILIVLLYAACNSLRKNVFTSFKCIIIPFDSRV